MTFHTPDNKTSHNDPMRFEFQQKKAMRSQILLEEGLLKKIEWKNILPARREAVHFVITDKTVNALYGKNLLRI